MCIKSKKIIRKPGEEIKEREKRRWKRIELVKVDIDQVPEYKKINHYKIAVLKARS